MTITISISISVNDDLFFKYMKKIYTMIMFFQLANMRSSLEIVRISKESQLRMHLLSQEDMVLQAAYNL